jgi:ectoine hydroxylase-related dioxygenase (phytanoyl-CoA dioxygenase family)
VCTDAHSAALATDGFAVIRAALAPAQVARAVAALERVYRSDRGRSGGRVHVLGGIGRDDAFLDLVDHPAVLPLVSRELGWNIHVYHCHLDVTPPGAEAPPWGWHQDGGRQNVDLDGDPRPRMSLKVAWWLSDVSEPGRGNMLVVPGSHTRNRLSRDVEPAGAVPLLACRGDAVVFDRRLWHSRSANRSRYTRRAVFLAYTYRWVRQRDDLGVDAGRLARLPPARRRLLGDGESPQSFWGLGGEPAPL